MLTTFRAPVGKICDMANPIRIHRNKTPIRRHFLKEWMEVRNLEATDIIEQIEADRSTVYRWLSGQMPQPIWQERLAALFQIEPEALLRHPDDDWISRKLRGRSREEIERMKQMIELAFPSRTGTND